MLPKPTLVSNNNSSQNKEGSISQFYFLIIKTKILNYIIIAPPKKNKSIFVFYNEEQPRDLDLDNIDAMLAEYRNSILPIAGKEYVNPLDFWKGNACRWPILAKLAQRVLGVQASSAQCERIFSLAGHIFNPKRRRTGVKNFERLVFLKLNEELL